MWRVTGGSDKGGILVRQGLDLKSPGASERLATGAIVWQLELSGDRLNYKLLTGTGPQEGWVSIKISGKVLLEQITPGAVDLEALKLKADSDSDQYVQNGELEDVPDWSGMQPPPPHGKFVPESTGRVPAGKFWTPRLPRVPRHLRKVCPFDEHLRAKPMKEVNEAYEAMGDTAPVGHWYGLEFPHTLQMIKDFGAEFLTKALHAAGTLPKDNSVTKMEVEEFIGGSMSLKCFLHVEYEKPDDELHTDLFVKYPFKSSNAHERKATYIQRFIMNNDGPEMDFARILSSGAPMKCPKYYFGDICMKTALAILITEKLPLPAHHSEDFGPYELEAIPYKSVDYLLDRPFDYYDAMTRNIAQLAAWGKCGKLGDDIEKVFPPPSHPAAYFMSTKKRLEESFLPTIFIHAPFLFPDEIIGSRGSVRDDEWLVATLREVLPEVEKYQALILDYLFLNPDYGGFSHQNMNTDNAMFWRDGDGKVCSGFIDWGRFKRDNFARGLSNGYMCCDLCELVQLSDEQWIRNFIEAFVSSGGPHLDFDLFWEHYMLSWLLQGLAAVDLPRQLTLTGSPHVLPENLNKLKSYKDPRIFRLPGYNNGQFAIFRNFVYYWRCRDLPAFWQRWKKAHIDFSSAKEKWKLK